MEQYCPSSRWPGFEYQRQHHYYVEGVSYCWSSLLREVLLQVLPFSPLLKNQILIHCGKHLQLMILGALIVPQVYQLSDLLSVHLAEYLFLLHHLLLLFFYYCLSKNCFLAVDLARLYQGLQILDKTGGKIKSPSPPPIKDRKKHGAFFFFFFVFLLLSQQELFSGCGPGQVNNYCIRRPHILDKTGGKLDPPPSPPQSRMRPS